MYSQDRLSDGIKLNIAFKGLQEEGCQCHCWLWRAGHGSCHSYAFTVTLTFGTPLCSVVTAGTLPFVSLTETPWETARAKKVPVAVEFEVRTVLIVSGFSSPAPVSVLFRRAAPSLGIIKTTFSKVCFPLCSVRFLPFYWNWGQFAVLCRGTLNLVASDLTLEVWILVQSSLLFVLYLMKIKFLSQFAFLNRVRLNLMCTVLILKLVLSLASRISRYASSPDTSAGSLLFYYLRNSSWWREAWLFTVDCSLICSGHSLFNTPAL